MREKLPILEHCVKPFTNIVFEIIVSVKLFSRSYDEPYSIFEQFAQAVLKPRAVNEKILALCKRVRNHEERSDINTTLKK